MGTTNKDHTRRIYIEDEWSDVSGTDGVTPLRGLL